MESKEKLVKLQGLFHLLSLGRLRGALFGLLIYLTQEGVVKVVVYTIPPGFLSFAYMALISFLRAYFEVCGMAGKLALWRCSISINKICRR